MSTTPAESTPVPGQAHIPPPRRQLSPFRHWLLKGIVDERGQHQGPHGKRPSARTRGGR